MGDRVHEVCLVGGEAAVEQVVPRGAYAESQAIKRRKSLASGIKLSDSPKILGN